MSRSRANPWRTLGSRVVYRNPWIGLREDRVLRPDGLEGIYGVLEAPRAVGVLALHDDDRVQLVGQWRYALEGWSWEIVEGGAHADETLLAAGQRELREEAGLEARAWRALGEEAHLSNSFTDERAYIYLATGLTEVGADPEATEQLELRAEPLDVCLDMVDAGEITDAMTLIALLRLDRWRRTGRAPGRGGSPT
jgi:8-oxo-dGTP pyrophosphatase MutT (NUDIX family)